MNKFILLIIILLIFKFLNDNTSKREGMSESYDEKMRKIELYNIMSNNYNEIFPNNQNRNSAGYRFFKYFYNLDNMNHEDFNLYNQFYCAVSGSVVSPRPNNFNIIKMKDLNGNDHFGKYYRCCTPCLSDIMRYGRLVITNIDFNGVIKEYKLITIKDPCQSTNSIPDGIDENVLNCNNNYSSNALRINTDGQITTGPGRMIIGVLHDINDQEIDLYSETVEILEKTINGNKRICTESEQLQYGMGDIFVEFALMNGNETNDDLIQDEFCNN